MDRPDHDPEPGDGSDAPDNAGEGRQEPVTAPNSWPGAEYVPQTGLPPYASVGPIPSRWTLIRDLVAFQFKLVVDGLRDVLLSPLSLIVALLGLSLGRRDWFYDLLVLARRSERWIDLFSAASRVSPRPPGDDGRAPRWAAATPTVPGRPAAYAATSTAQPPPPEDTAPDPGQDEGRSWYSDPRWGAADHGGAPESLDALIGRLETRLQEQYERGGMTARAKRSVDRLLDAIERQARRTR
jgi:hypothetical protein